MRLSVQKPTNPDRNIGKSSGWLEGLWWTRDSRPCRRREPPPGGAVYATLPGHYYEEM